MLTGFRSGRGVPSGSTLSIVLDKKFRGKAVARVFKPPDSNGDGVALSLTIGITGSGGGMVCVSARKKVSVSEVGRVSNSGFSGMTGGVVIFRPADFLRRGSAIGAVRT